MERTYSVAIAGHNFTLTESAFMMLKQYLNQYESLAKGSSSAPSMESLEKTIADYFTAKQTGENVIIDKIIVKETIEKIGLPAGEYKTAGPTQGQAYSNIPPSGKKFFRDMNAAKIGGVCSGLSIWLGADVTLLRILFILAMIFGLSGFWIYLIIWIIAPAARTPEEKCAQYGIPPTEENKAQFK